MNKKIMVDWSFDYPIQKDENLIECEVVSDDELIQILAGEIRLVTSYIPVVDVDGIRIGWVYYQDINYYWVEEEEKNKFIITGRE